MIHFRFLKNFFAIKNQKTFKFGKNRKFPEERAFIGQKHLQPPIKHLEDRRLLEGGK